MQRADWVLTPHPGEAGRLLGSGSAEVQADRFARITSYNVCYTKLLRSRPKLYVAKAQTRPGRTWYLNLLYRL